MTIELPRHIEDSIIAKVHSGLFPSMDAAMTKAALLLLEQIEQEQATPQVPTTSKANAISEAEFKQQLFATGLMTSLPLSRDAAPRPEFQPVMIEGESLSETIIRERR